MSQTSWLARSTTKYLEILPIISRIAIVDKVKFLQADYRMSKFLGYSNVPSIVINTKKVIIDGYNLGKYTIHIGFITEEDFEYEDDIPIIIKNDTYGLRFRSRNESIGGYDIHRRMIINSLNEVQLNRMYHPHPHITLDTCDGSGDICLGSAYKPMHDYFRKEDILSATLLFLQYLITYNAKDMLGDINIYPMYIPPKPKAPPKATVPPKPKAPLKGKVKPVPKFVPKLVLKPVPKKAKPFKRNKSKVLIPKQYKDVRILDNLPQVNEYEYKPNDKEMSLKYGVGPMVHIITDTIVCVDTQYPEDDFLDLGKFDIKVGLQYGKDTYLPIIIKSLDFPIPPKLEKEDIDDYRDRVENLCDEEDPRYMSPHPHMAWTTGRQPHAKLGWLKPCWGTFKPILHKAVRTKDTLSILMLIMQFMTTYNSDDALDSLCDFPTIPNPG